MTELQVSDKGDCTVVALTGKIDAATTPLIQTRLLALVHEGKKYIALNFESVTFLASSGLRMLLVVNKEIKSLEGKLVLCDLAETMRDTLEVAGFLPFFVVTATTDEALHLLGE